MEDKVLQKQKQFFKSGSTLNISFRIKELKKLKRAVLKEESRIISAIKSDTGRPETEIYASEIYTVIKEIDLFIKNISKWSRPRKVKTPLLLKPGSSRVYLEPYGTVLIISPWNYPFQLLLSPLAGAVAAGNCAVVKPSEISEKTSEVIVNLIEKNFSDSYIYPVSGGPETVQKLLKKNFNLIFFTGGREVGRIVMRNAAENLTPVILELGGKCPCIVTGETDIKRAAKRICWAKFFNAGQTCVAPDYVLVRNDLKKQFVSQVKNYIREFYGDDPARSSDYGKIINEKHFNRIKGLLNKKEEKLLQTDIERLHMSPLIIDNPKWEDKIMREEIFGPILPVMGYNDFKEALTAAAGGSSPLAVYLFTKNKDKVKAARKNIPSGSLVINEALIQLSSNYLPFGGVGLSGMGRYRGEASFKAFSSQKSFLKRKLFPDWKFRYPPYKKGLDELKKYLKYI